MTSENKTARDERPNRPKRAEKATRRRAHSRAHGPLAFLERYKEPGFAYHLESDNKSNIFYLLEDGWAYVLKDDGSKVGLHNYGIDASGDSYSAYLMKIPQEDYDELYTAAREEEIKTTERGVEGQLMQNQKFSDS